MHTKGTGSNTSQTTEAGKTISAHHWQGCRCNGASEAATSQTTSITVESSKLTHPHPTQFNITPIPPSQRRIVFQRIFEMAQGGSTGRLTSSPSIPPVEWRSYRFVVAPYKVQPRGDQMKIRTVWPMLLLLLFVGVLGTRLAWTLTTSETGWRPHLDQWGKVASDLFGIEHPALSDQPPKQQAEFWFHEVETVEQANHDPMLAMGAAWMLDAPQYGFIQHHVRMKEDLDFPGIPASWRRELDWETIGTLSEEFESLCREECLAKMDTAIRLDGSNAELWRARALLLFQTKSMSMESEPRREDWLATLDECATRDPENALYDYLAALGLWASSAEYDWEEDGYILKVENEETFERGNAHLASGLTKPHLKSGVKGYAATLAFLEETSVTKVDHLTAAGSRQIDGRVNNLLYRIMRWQSVQLDVQKREENLEAAVAALQSVLRISDQITEAGNYPNLATPKLVLRQWSLANLEDMHEDYPDLFNADEAERVSSESATVQFDLKVLQEAGKRLAEKAGTSVSTEVSTGTVVTLPKKLLAVFVMVAAQMLVIVTVGMAVVSWLGARLCGASGDDEAFEMRSV